MNVPTTTVHDIKAGKNLNLHTTTSISKGYYQLVESKYRNHNLSNKNINNTTTRQSLTSLERTTKRLKDKHINIIA